MSRPATVAILLALGAIAIPVAENAFEIGAPAPATREAAPQTTRSLPRSPQDAAIVQAASPVQPAQVAAPATVPASLPTSVENAPTPATPQMLELVTILPVTGTRAPDPQPITRADAVTSVMTSPEFQQTVSPLARLYLATFGRYPDYEGINYYTGQREEARPLPAIADEFAGSREFELRYGKLTDAEFVARIVANVLGDESQADVRAYWTNELQAGRMTRGQVIVDLSESGAFRERSANATFVSTAYVEILQRTPDPDGYARWVEYLNAGAPMRGVIDGLLAGR